MRFTSDFMVDEKKTNNEEYFDKFMQHTFGGDMSERVSLENNKDVILLLMSGAVSEAKDLQDAEVKTGFRTASAMPLNKSAKFDADAKKAEGLAFEAGIKVGASHARLKAIVHEKQATAEECKECKHLPKDHDERYCHKTYTTYENKEMPCPCSCSGIQKEATVDEIGLIDDIIYGELYEYERVELIRAFVKKEVERALSKRPEGSRDGPDWRTFTHEELQAIHWGDLCGVVPIGLNARGLLLIKIKQQAVEKAMEELVEGLAQFKEFGGFGYLYWEQYHEDGKEVARKWAREAIKAARFPKTKQK
jgi:hypothetical protein